MSESFNRSLRQLLKSGEGSIAHMYLDTVGKVTIGVGNMLPDVNAATTLPFIDRQSGSPASESKIADEFGLVGRQEAGRVASYYRQFCTLELPESGIDELLQSRIEEFAVGLRLEFPGFDALMESARLGLFDMAFNLGVSGVVNKFPSFTRAVREGDWTACARECRRPQVSDSRNREVRNLFLNCMRPEGDE